MNILIYINLDIRMVTGVSPINITRIPINDVIRLRWNIYPNIKMATAKATVRAYETYMAP